MKRIFTLRVVFVLLLGVGVSVGANAQVFSKGDKVISLGYGLGGLAGVLGNGGTKFPPLLGSFEYGLVDGFLRGKGSVGIGGFLGYEARQFSGYYYNLDPFESQRYAFNRSLLLIGATADFHYNPFGKLDTYAGLRLGYYAEGYSSHYDIENGSENGIFLDPHIGARYYLFNNFGAFGEIGFGGAKVGLSYNFSTSPKTVSYATETIAPFRKGVKTLSGRLSGLDLSYSDTKTGGGKQFKMDLNVAGSYFVADKIAIEGIIGTSVYAASSTTAAITLGVGARYYLHNGLFAGAGYQLVGIEDMDLIHYLNAQLGYTYYITKNIFLEPAIYYKKGFYGYYFPTEGFNNLDKSSTIGLSVGIGVKF